MLKKCGVFPRPFSSWDLSSTDRGPGACRWATGPRCGVPTATAYPEKQGCSRDGRSTAKTSCGGRRTAAVGADRDGRSRLRSESRGPRDPTPGTVMRLDANTGKVAESTSSTYIRATCRRIVSDGRRRPSILKRGNLRARRRGERSRSARMASCSGSDRSARSGPRSRRMGAAPCRRSSTATS